MLVLLLILLAALGGSETYTRHTVLNGSDEPFLKTLWERGRTMSRAGMISTDGQSLAFAQWECRPCAELFDAPLALLCCRQTRYYFKPAGRSWIHSFLDFLLLIGGVERNPGPTNVLKTNMGLVNARSMVNKTALIHDVIKDNRLDFLAVTETWVYNDSPEVHKKDAAPPGYSIVHAHRDTSRSTGKRQGGGIAFIHREDLRVKVLPPPLAGPVTFELLLVKVINCTLGMTIAIIYRPPNTNPSAFISELSDLLYKGSLGSRFIICGDLNCPGPSGSEGLVGKDLAELIDGYSLTQHVHGPTHNSGNILDHILTLKDGVVVNDVTIQNVGLSDHSFIKCNIAVDIKRQPIIRASFRNWKSRIWTGSENEFVHRQHI